MDIFKQFRFESAHYLPTFPEGHPYRRLHGHSFLAEITLSGQPDPVQGWIADLGGIERALAPLREQLDHGLLNDVPGLEVPTLENIARWLWRHLKPAYPGLAEITLRRESCNEGCRYRGDLDR